MKKATILFLIILNLATGQDTSLWSRISNKTWFTDHVNMGQSLVFYENIDGKKKAIIQRHGSGVYVVSYSEYDVFIKNSEVHFATFDSIHSETISDESLSLILKEHNRLISADGLST